MPKSKKPKKNFMSGYGDAFIANSGSEVEISPMIDPALSDSLNVLADKVAAVNDLLSPSISNPKLSSELVGNPSEIGRKLVGNCEKKAAELVGNPSEIGRKKKPKKQAIGRKLVGNPSDKPSDGKLQLVGNPSEIGRKPDEYSGKEVALLVGYQRAVFNYIFVQAQAFGSSNSFGDRISPRINSNEIVKAVSGKSSAQIRDVLSEVVKCGFLSREFIKSGPGGFTVYKLPERIYNKKLLDQSVGNQSEIGRKLVGNPSDKPSDKPSEMAPSSSRDLINKESTTEQASGSQIADQVDVLSVSSFGISKSTIARAVQLNPNLELEDLQNLIFRFGEYASDPKNKMQSPVGFFLGLCKQLGQGMIPLEHIQTPDEKLMADLAKQSRAAAAQRQETEDALLAFEFEAWMETITAEKRNELVPESVAVRPGSHAQTMMLKKHYVENLWDVRRKELLRTARDLTLTI